MSRQSRSVPFFFNHIPKTWKSQQTLQLHFVDEMLKKKKSKTAKYLKFGVFFKIYIYI